MDKKSYFTQDNIKNFIQGYYQYFKWLYDDNDTHVAEQALYRAMLCSECLVKGKCTECGCSTPAMFFSKDKVDSLGRWGKMLEKTDWDQFKKDNDIEVINSFQEIMNESLINNTQYKRVKPSWFIYRGVNYFTKMSSLFLSVLDEISYKDIFVVHGYNPDDNYNSYSALIKVDDNSNLIDFFREIDILGLSFKIEKKVDKTLYIRIELTHPQRYIVNE